MVKLPVAHNRFLWRRVGRLFGAYRLQVVSVLILQILAAVAAVALPYITGDIIDRIDGGTTLHTVMVMIGIALVIVCVGAVLTYWAERNSRILGETIFAHLREDLMETVTHLPLSVVEEAGTGDLLGRTTRDIERVQFIVRQGLSSVLTITTTIIVTFGAAILTSPPLSAALLVPIPAVIVVMRWYLPRTVPAYRAGASAWASMSGVIAETMDQAETVDAARLMERRNLKLDEAVREVWRLERYTAWQRIILWSTLIVAVFLPIGVTILVGSWLLPYGIVTVGQITTVALYCYQVRGPMWDMAFWIDEIQSSQAALGRIFGVDMVQPDRQSTDDIPSDNHLNVHDVRYAYRADREVLHGVSLDLVPGETLAVVGPSGAGKSTLGRLLAGIHPTTSGHVHVGGVDLVNLPEDLLHKQVILVSQEHHVFVGTIADNLRLAKADATADELQSAMSAVGAHSWIDQLPDALETAVGASGRELSPGQAQQLALARIVLLNPHTLVLDEATSLMDPSAARSLEKSLSRVLEGRTVVAIAHRLHTAHDADRVAVMIDGRLAELGSHEALVKAGGDYASLWHSWQSE